VEFKGFRPVVWGPWPFCFETYGSKPRSIQRQREAGALGQVVAVLEVSAVLAVLAVSAVLAVLVFRAGACNNNN